MSRRDEVDGDGDDEVVDELNDLNDLNEVVVDAVDVVDVHLPKEPTLIIYLISSDTLTRVLINGHTRLIHTKQLRL